MIISLAKNTTFCTYDWMNEVRDIKKKEKEKALSQNKVALIMCCTPIGNDER